MRAIRLAFLLLAGLLIFGPAVEEQVGHAVGHASTVAGLWWIVQWPILVFALLGAFATMLYLGPDVDERSWRLITPGALVAAVIRLTASGAFAFYTAHFDSYNKAWGPLTAVIVMLTWLWLAGLALLFGAELDSEIDAGRAAGARAAPRVPIPLQTERAGADRDR